MTEPKKDLDTPQKIRAALFKWVIRTSYHRGKDEVQDIIDRIPSPDAGEPKRDEAGLREAATFVEALGPIIDLLDLDGFDGEAECLRDLRTALAAHPAPSEPEGKALQRVRDLAVDSLCCGTLEDGAHRAFREVLSTIDGKFVRIVQRKAEPEAREGDALRKLGWSMILGVPTYERVPGSGDWATVTNTVPVDTWHAAIQEAKRQPQPQAPAAPYGCHHPDLDRCHCHEGERPSCEHWKPQLPKSPWRPIEEFDGTEDTYFIISDGSPFDACFDQGEWWISGIDEPVHPTRFMPIPDYPEWKARREAQYWEGTP